MAHHHRHCSPRHQGSYNDTRQKKQNTNNKTKPNARSHMHRKHHDSRDASFKQPVDATKPKRHHDGFCCKCIQFLAGNTSQTLQLQARKKPVRTSLPGKTFPRISQRPTRSVSQSTRMPLVAKGLNHKQYGHLPLHVTMCQHLFFLQHTLYQF